ncbi:Glutathione peroxidase [Heracleum sosnowskyi]|uniref:Glutathione peroxidase n=1 Tax=Heracleum sosnowskyi TaxID=360622 RepID=A0AAD8N133_9APIA|nr:Glutathione peroxidase [Heracleum sosnowskyi]
MNHWSSLSVLLLALLFIYILPYTFPSFSFSAKNMDGETSKSIYNFTVKDIRGNDVPLSNYNGKVLLVVNVASKCGFTQSNYKELNILYEKYKDQGLEILAFPCNQFGWQEPGTNEEIQDTVCTNFKAEFPIFDKVEVNGKNAAPLYKFLKAEKGGLLVDAIKWNFTKFLINKEGKVIARYAPSTSPLKIEEDIQNLLGSS